MISHDLLEQLLHDSEGTTLDFKEKQYPFVGATEDQKAELLKDILAFANSWGREDAYILIGVRAVPGGRSELVGLDFDLDDAHLQEFVNGKTNRRVIFSYETTSLDGKKIGVIKIPRQQRPIFLRNDYGLERSGGQKKLKANAVYYRQGSSTCIANPKEVYRMGSLDAGKSISNPSFRASFVDFNSQRSCGTRIQMTTTDWEYTQKEIPLLNSGGAFGYADPMHNSEYLRDIAAYIRFKRGAAAVRFQVCNTSEALATDVRIEIEIPNSAHLHLIEMDDAPDRPRKHRDFGIRRGVMSPKLSLRIISRNEIRFLVANFGKIQAAQTVILPDCFYILPAKSEDIDLEQFQFICSAR